MPDSLSADIEVLSRVISAAAGRGAPDWHKAIIISLRHVRAALVAQQQAEGKPAFPCIDGCAVTQMEARTFPQPASEGEYAELLGWLSREARPGDALDEAFNAIRALLDRLDGYRHGHECEDGHISPWALAACSRCRRPRGTIGELMAQLDAAERRAELLAAECRAWRVHDSEYGAPHSDDPLHDCDVCTVCAATDAAGALGERPEQAKEESPR